MFTNPYYSPQASIDRINSQIAELEKLKAQIPANQITPSINQTFQLAPNNGNMKYAKSIDEVQKEFVIYDTPYFSEDMSVLWIKNNKGEIKTYTLAEIIQKDEKDLIIENLQAQVYELKKGEQNAKSNNDNVIQSIESEKPSNVSHNRTSKKK